MTIQIGSFKLPLGIALSPMAGITDNPLRKICKQFGATWVVGEMISGDPTLKHTHKTMHRIKYTDENKPIVMQILGHQPEKMASAAKFYESIGADVIDINMGCPAKKVCNTFAGSALMRDEKLVEKIIEQVVSAVTIPVTLKTRLGWDDQNLNVLNIAKLAEKKGISAIAIHGRSRTQMFKGLANYDLIKVVKQEVGIPVWANGDIDSAEKAQKVLADTKADGIMIGRAAQGKPWIFYEITEFLLNGTKRILPFNLISRTIKEHLLAIYDFYGNAHGYKIARKHIGWYLNHLTNNPLIRKEIYLLETKEAQFEMINQILTKPEVEDYYYKNYKHSNHP